VITFDDVGSFDPPFVPEKKGNQQKFSQQQQKKQKLKPTC
jgi:hypothetical protein